MSNNGIDIEFKFAKSSRLLAIIRKLFLVYFALTIASAYSLMSLVVLIGTFCVFDFEKMCT